MNNKKPICPRCFSYMLDFPKMLGWKRCVGCGYAEDSNGNNKLTEVGKTEPERDGIYHKPSKGKENSDD